MLIRMPVLAALALLLTACSAAPKRFEWFKLPPGAVDVVWTIHGDKLHRCWHEADGPVCMPARFRPAVPDAPISGQIPGVTRWSTPAPPASSRPAD